MLWLLGTVFRQHTPVYRHQTPTAMFLIWDPARVRKCFRRARYVCVFSSGSFRIASARVSFTCSRLRPAPKVSPGMKSFANNTMWSLLIWKCAFVFRLQIRDLYAGFLLSCSSVVMKALGREGCWWGMLWRWLNVSNTHWVKHYSECSTESSWVLTSFWEIISSISQIKKQTQLSNLGFSS